MSATHVQSTPTPWKTSVQHPEYMTSLPPSGAPDDDLSFHSTPALPTNPNWRCLCVWTAILEATASISHIILISHRIMQSHSIGKTKGRLMQIADCLSRQFRSSPRQKYLPKQNETSKKKKKMWWKNWNGTWAVMLKLNSLQVWSKPTSSNLLESYQELCSTTRCCAALQQVLCSATKCCAAGCQCSKRKAVISQHRTWPR